MHVDRACCQASGSDWFGHRILRPGPVVILCLEGLGALTKKILRWKELRGFKPTDKIGVRHPRPCELPAADERPRPNEAS